MKIKYLLISAATVLTGCTATTHHEPETTAAEEHEHDHSGEILLDPEMGQSLGVTLGSVEAGDFRSVVRATGTLERSAADMASAPAPTAGTISFRPGITAGVRVERGTHLAGINTEAVSGGNADAAARADYEAARTEMERIESLYADRLVTEADYTAAKAALERSRAMLSRGGSSAMVTAPISGTITAVNAAEGGYVQPGDAVVTIAADGAMTLRVDVPSRHYSELSAVDDARFSIAGDSVITISSIGGRRLDGLAANGGYATLYFTVPGRNNLPAGAPAEVWLLGKQRQGVVTVAGSALIEQQGDYYVFEATHPEHGAYRKVQVTPGAADGERVEILSGLRGGERIVTAGATAVRLAEMQSVVPEGHSHNH